MIFRKRTYFECIIPERNKHTFYELVAGRDLFGYVVIRRWGRIDTKGQPRKRQRFQEEQDMMKEYKRIHNERIKHQYVPVRRT